MNITDSGIQIEKNSANLWFRLNEPGRGQYFRVVNLTELASIPVSAREDYDLLQKQYTAVRGLYGAHADYVYAACGIYKPDHIGIVQFYGGTGEDDSLDGAIRLAARNLAAVRAGLANFEQSRVKSPDPLYLEWYFDFVTRRAQNPLALLGHPDPRTTQRGLGKDGAMPNNTGDDLAAEQNELLFRGLAALQKDFVFQVTSARMDGKTLAEGLKYIANLTTGIASRQRGSLSIGFNLSIPLAMALSQAQSGGRATSQSQSEAQATGESHTTSKGHTDSYAYSESESSTVGGSESHSLTVTHSDGESWAKSAAHSKATGVSEGTSHTDSGSVTNSVSDTTSRGESHGTSSNWSRGTSQNWSSGTSVNHSTGSSEGFNTGTSQSHGTTYGTSGGSSVSGGTSTGHTTSTGVSNSHSQSQNWAESSADQVNGGLNAGIPGVVGGNFGGSHTQGTSSGGGASDTTGFSSGEATSTGESSGWSTQAGWSEGRSDSHGSSAGHSWGTSSSSGSGSFSSTGGGTSQSVGGGESHSVSTGTAHSVGRAESKGWADSTSRATSRSEGDTVGNTHAITSADSVSEGWSVTKSWARSRGTTRTWGQSDSTGEAHGTSKQSSTGTAQGSGISAAQGFSSGLSGGIVPGVSIGQSWQSEDELAIRLTEVMRAFVGQMQLAAAEGAFMTSAVIFTEDDEAAAAAATLAPQAFHGINVPTPVLAVSPQGEQAEELRNFTLAWKHFGGKRERDPLMGYLFTEFATLLTPAQNAAYTAPGLFEEGSAMTVMPPIPKGTAFYPRMKGDILIGHQFSPETGLLTNAPVTLDTSRMMHTLFAADTGWGKSVAAMRMAYESTLKAKTRTIVMDFGAGWRSLLNAPGLRGHINILQLWPDAVRPFRWNPLQIGRMINPETQWRAFADIFGSIAKLGVKRQKQELLAALREVYLRVGALVDDPALRKSPLGVVASAAEAALVGAPENTPLGNLTREQRQLLAVERSSAVGLADLHEEIETKRNGVPSRDTMLQGVLDGILFRLQPLVHGQAALQFAPGPTATPLEDLSLPWGITVIEGGMFLDDFGKAFLLGWAGWHLYTDRVARRVHNPAMDEPLLQIYFEEANKVFGGMDTGSDDEGGGTSTSQRFADMFRDARKYGCRLHVVTQAPHLIPDDIVSSCNNLIVGFLKQPKDKDIVLSAFAKSEKGFRDEEWRRFVTNMPIGTALGRLPYSMEREAQQMFVFQPLLLDVPEPTDADIEAALGRIVL